MILDESVYRSMAKHEEAARLRGQAAAILARASLLDWMAFGCRCDRSGVLGVSLLGSARAVKKRLAAAVKAEGGAP